jgi:gamma-glutamyl-gamma-aminobutyrate hydrolase PuuD
MNHTITTIDGEQMEVTSAHHQMCNPTGTNHELLAWSTTNRSKHYMGEFDKQIHMDCEPEVIYYPDMNALAVQPHPEWMSPDSEFVQYLYKLIEEKLL